MTRESINLEDRVYQYLLSVSLRESTILKQLREETAKHEWAQLQISPEEGQFLALLVRLLNAKKIIEIGVFTGYSSLWMAEALPPDGKLIACEVNENYANVAHRYWQLAGVDHKVELKLAPALETLDTLLEAAGDSTFDLVFIDAMKTEYIDYYERALRLLRPGGMIAVDNTLWSGSVADPDDNDNLTMAIRQFNAHVHADSRIDMSLLPLGDGVTLCRKK